MWQQGQVFKLKAKSGHGQPQVGGFATRADGLRHRHAFQASPNAIQEGRGRSVDVETGSCRLCS
jgi:hypothetical protein